MNAQATYDLIVFVRNSMLLFFAVEKQAQETCNLIVFDRYVKLLFAR